MSKNKEQNPTKNDEFDLSEIRVGQNFADLVGVKRAIVQVPVRKPTRQEFFRVHPDESWRLQALILELKDERENYLVSPKVANVVTEEASVKMLLTAQNRQGVTFLWPIAMARADGRTNSWNQSAFDCALLAQKEWVRICAKMSMGGYEPLKATATFPEPEWPEDLGFQGIIRIAFKERFINTVDHPIIRRLKGEQ